MEYLILILLGVPLLLYIVSRYDSYTTPTKAQLQDLQHSAKEMYRINTNIRRGTTDIAKLILLKKHRRVIAKIYKLSIKGTKGQTLADLVEESATLIKQYKAL